MCTGKIVPGKGSTIGSVAPGEKRANAAPENSSVSSVSAPWRSTLPMQQPLPARPAPANGIGAPKLAPPSAEVHDTTCRLPAPTMLTVPSGASSGWALWISIAGGLSVTGWHVPPAGTLQYIVLSAPGPVPPGAACTHVK